MKSFWQELRRKKQPFFVLAPMEDVTDTVFRRVVASVASPDVFFTEFTSVEGLFSEGRLTVGRRLDFTEDERPLVAQIWGLKPENFYKAAKYLVERGFDGIDINMGCPDTSVTSKGMCSALIKNPNLAKEMIQATKEGAVKKGTTRICLPVSVKTRIGYYKPQIEGWCGFLLEQGIDALTVHGRTVKEMSKVPAHWDEIGKVVELRDQMKLDIPIIGNGDVKSIKDGREKADTTRVDGIMIGRGVFENLWIFKENYNALSVTPEQRVSILLRHLQLYEEHPREKHSFQTLKKFSKIYIRDFDGAGELRGKLMEAKSTEEAREIIGKLG